MSEYIYAACKYGYHSPCPGGITDHKTQERILCTCNCHEEAK